MVILRVVTHKIATTHPCDKCGYTFETGDVYVGHGSSKRTHATGKNWCVGCYVDAKGDPLFDQQDVEKMLKFDGKWLK